MALPTSFSPSSSSCSFSPSSFRYPWKYDVFLNFRGPDARHGFVGHLHKALCDEKIHTFIDDEELQRGEEIAPSLAKAIEESRIAIPVFSENYASSAFCLDELVKIMECVHGKGRLVLPVFYKVDPGNVRHQRGSYGEALTRHEESFKYDDKKVQRWRQALHQAADLAGEHLKGNEYECELIVKIVKEISKKSFVPLYVAKYPVGLQSRVVEVNQLLNDGSQCGVHMVGIYGIGGIGKTTLAKAVYNSVADQFESLCFIENMSELSDRHGLVYLQKIVLSKILGRKVRNLGSADEGFSIIQKRLCGKNVLLVLDNVDKHEHLQAIVRNLEGLGSRSRVIITTRNKHLLTTHKVKKVYEVGILNEKDAVELFSRNAFEFGKGEPCYMDILKKLVTYASGLPLALEVIGSSLFGKSVKEWISALDVYKKVPDENVLEKLKVSYKGLTSLEQEFFLDIACCFKGYELAKVEDILHAHYDVDPRYMIRVLVDKSLIKINNGFHDVITLHDLIQEMGREIVRSESPEKLEERSRLWFAKDIIEVLQRDNGSSKIQVINLECDYNGDVIQWDGQAFGKMEKLRTLIIRKCKFSQGPTHLPNSLRVLIWDTYSSEEFLPSYFNPKHLAMLELPRNCFDSVHLAELLKKKFENMRILKLDYYKCITKIPNLSSAPKLEVLSFAGCDNLTEIDESVGSLAKLKTLNASACRQLGSFPPLMLPSLEGLGLDGCTSLESFPEILGKMEKMTELSLSAVPIKKLPCSIHNLTGLQSLFMWSGGIFDLTSTITLPEVRILRLWSCEGLLLPNEDEGEEHVSSMSLSNKTELDIIDCRISSEFLRIALPMFPRLQSLRLERENFRIVPECIRELQFLRRLHLIDCEEVAEIEGIPPNIEELFVVNCRFLSSSTTEMLLNEKLHEEGQDKTFMLPQPRLPMWFEYWRRGLSIVFWFRNKFPAISFGLFTRSDPLDQRSIQPRLIINGGKSFQLVVNDSKSSEIPQVGHILIFSKIQATFRDQVGEVLSENEWNRAVLSVYDDPPWWYNRCDLKYVRVGIHIIKEKRCMDDIIFTDPLLQECDTLTDMGDSQTQTQFVQQHQQQTNSAPLGQQVGQGTELLSLPPASPSAFINYVNWPSNSKEMSSTTTTLNVQGSDVDSWIFRKEWLSLRSFLEALLHSDLSESNLMQSALSHAIMDPGSDVDSWIYSENSLSLLSCLKKLLEGDILKSNLVRSKLRSLILKLELVRSELRRLNNMDLVCDLDSWIYRKNSLSLRSCLEKLLDCDIFKSNLVRSELRSLTIMDPVCELDSWIYRKSTLSLRSCLEKLLNCDILKSDLLRSELSLTIMDPASDIDSWIFRKEWPSLRPSLEKLSDRDILKSNLVRSELRSLTIIDPASDIDSWIYRKKWLSLRSSSEKLLDCDILKSNLVRSELRSLNIMDPGSDVDSWIYRKNWLSLRSCLEELLDRDIWGSNLVPSELRSLTVMDPGTGSFYVEELAGAVLDHLENCRVESSQAPSYAETQNIQVPYYPSSSGVVCGEEPHLKTCCTVFPTTTEESLRNQVEQSQEHVEMESSGTHILSHSHDHSSTTATSEDSKDALKLVQDFTTNVPFTNPLEDAYNNSDSNSMQSSRAIHATNSLPKKCLVLFLCLLLIVVSVFGSTIWHWCFHRNYTLPGTSLQGHQRLTSINQHNLEGCESVNNAKEKEMVALTCKSNAAEDGGKKPITENLSTTKAMSGSYEPSIHSENVDKPVNSLIEIQPPSPQPLDPLAELERVLLGSYDPTLESTSPTAASSDFQASEVVIILQNLEPLLDNPLESLIADGEKKHQILDCLSELGLLEDHIPVPLQSIVAQIKDFYEDLIHNFPSIQQTLVDYSCLEETRSKFLENLKQAKVKQAQIDAEVSREKIQLEELDAGIADLEIKLKAAVEKRNELQLAIKNGEIEKNKILKDASAWVMESKQVVKKMRSSEHAYRDAQNSKARLEGRLAMLKAAFAANNDKP